MVLLLMMSKDIVGKEYIYSHPTNISEIKEHASAITFVNYSMVNIPTSAFMHLSACKKLTFINTKTTHIDSDAWLGLSKLESLSIEKSYMTVLDTNIFDHLKSLTMLKVTTVHNSELQYFPRDSVPIKPAAFRGLDSLSKIWLSLPDLNEISFRSMNNDVWPDIGDTLTELMLPDNNFKKLYDDMFVLFTKLEKLIFQNNRIETISSKALNGLPVLKEIDLSKNKINEIAHESFQTLISLNEINLSDNEIDHLADNLFKGLKQLRILKLSNNRLKTIGCNLFHPMDFESSGGHPGKFRTSILKAEHLVDFAQRTGWTRIVLTWLIR